MATILLSSVGMAAGGAIGGSVLGLETAVIGRAIGAAMGRRIDQGIMQGRAEADGDGPDRFRLSGASEGQVLPQVFGQARIAGTIVWASDFKRDLDGSTGGKGGASAANDGSYSVSLALALCEGDISRVGRIWAEGEEIAPLSLNMRVYTGSETQLPDPLIEAVQTNAPAFRGTAYVVIEDLNLGRFGNRVPSFSFEVTRPSPAALPLSQSDPARFIEGVALIPGSGEYSLASTPLYGAEGFGETRPLNVNTAADESDFSTSLSALDSELPRCSSVSLVVSWFGTDLRCADCQIAPRVEPEGIDAETMPWRVSGLSRGVADVVPVENGVALYGGTPTDQSVIEAIVALKEKGKAVLFYPFILMAQTEGNGLTDPWTGQAGQPALPWRGRITTSRAPNVAGSPDGTAAAAAEISQFLGAAQAGDFVSGAGTVDYSGAADWGYRRFILHYAHLCALAGGVDAFCIGSEMRALTQTRDDTGSFPFVEGLRALAGEVRSILGPNCRISYAADWSEYHGYQPAGTSDKLFHLDPLWADENIDFIGIDNYMPLADWRAQTDHLDAAAGAIHNLDYLTENVAGGEGYDWYYHSPEARGAQIRSPISDYWGEDWVWRYKDLKGWWQAQHFDRIGGEKAAVASPWVPESKPIWFTELGCPAVHLGANQPNVFVDPKSSESALPYQSDGTPDAFMQAQYLRAVIGYYAQPEHNPISSLTGAPMLALDRCHVWAWDARPYPAFPAQGDVWSDAANYRLGHWINGRTSARGMAGIVAELCDRAGITRYDVSGLYGQVIGFVADRGQSAREILETLAVLQPFDVLEREGVLVFRSAAHREHYAIAREAVVDMGADAPAITRRRGAQEEGLGAFRLTHWEGQAEYATRAVDVRKSRGGGAAGRAALTAVLTAEDAYRCAERLLAEASAGREALALALPPSACVVNAGDVLTLDGDQSREYQVTSVLDEGHRTIEALAVHTAQASERTPAMPAPVVAKRVTARPVDGVFLDLPLLREGDSAHQPWFGATNAPWPGGVGLWASDAGDQDYALVRAVDRPAIIGKLLDPLPRSEAGLWDRGAAVRVKLVSGHLSSVPAAQLLSGANAAAIGDGQNWEVMQFAQAALVGVKTYALAERLRGQAGSDGVLPEAWPVGSYFVRIDDRLAQVPMARDWIGVTRNYRYGPEASGLASPAMRHEVRAFSGVGLRPYRVCHLRAMRDGSGDIRLSWIRRTRSGGDHWSEADVPLGEEREEYIIEAVTGSTVWRRWVVGTSQTTYSAAQMAEDGASGAMRFRVAQMSALFGAGPISEVAAP